MKPKGLLSGTKPLLTLIELIGIAEIALLASFTFGGGRVAVPFILYQVGLLYLIFSRSLGYARMFREGAWARGKNPALKPKSGAWFLALHIPQVLFSVAAPFVIFSLGGVFRCAAAVALLILKILLTQRVWPLLRAAPEGEANAQG